MLGMAGISEICEGFREIEGFSDEVYFLETSFLISEGYNRSIRSGRGGMTVLNITQNVNGDELVLSLDGRVDMSTAPELESILDSSLSDISVLKFDLEKLEYISDDGLNVFLFAQKIMSRQGKMILMNITDEVRDIFDEAGISDILTIV